MTRTPRGHPKGHFGDIYHSSCQDREASLIAFFFFLWTFPGKSTPVSLKTNHIYRVHSVCGLKQGWSTK